jgi:hypothetical protein
VPIPPLNPWQIIPVPPPTLPSGTGPAAAAARLISVVCPTLTPATSVIALCGPGFPVPATMPRSLARCAMSVLTVLVRLVSVRTAMRGGQ